MCIRDRGSLEFIRWKRITLSAWKIAGDFHRVSVVNDVVTCPTTSRVQFVDVRPWSKSMSEALSGMLECRLSTVSRRADKTATQFMAQSTRYYQ